MEIQCVKFSIPNTIHNPFKHITNSYSKQSQPLLYYFYTILKRIIRNKHLTACNIKPLGNDAKQTTKKVNNMKTIHINKSEQEALNLLRLDAIQQMEYLKDTVKHCEKHFSTKMQIKAINNLNTFKSLYNKLYTK